MAVEHHVGKRIRQYTLKKRLGVGGMGEAWLAGVNGPLGFSKNVVIKTMLPEMAPFLDHFSTEARLGGRLTHSNLVNVSEFFQEQGDWFIVMDYVEGVNGAELLEKFGRALPTGWAAYIAYHALKGLHFAHTAAIGGQDRRGVVHRDISPDNILISCDAEVKVSDFGIAQVSVEFRERTEARPAVKGKPAYAAPEQIDRALAKDLDGRVDLYQLGVVLYQFLTGVHPFAGSASAHQMHNRIVAGEAQPIREVNSDVDAALAAVVQAMMHKDRDQRPPTAQAAREMIYRAQPDLMLAERPIANFVLEGTARKRRLTSVFRRANDGAEELVAPPLGGVVVAAMADDATMRVAADRLAPIVRTQPLPDDRRDPNVPIPVAPKAREGASPPAPISPEQTERLRPSKTRRRRRAALAAAVGVLAVGGTVVGTYALRNHAAAASAARIQPVLVMPRTQPVEVAQAPRPSAVVAVAPPAAPAAASSMEAPAAPPEPKVRHRKSADEAASPPATTGRLVVAKEKEPISVEVDGIFVGKAPVSYEVEPGLHSVTIIRGLPPIDEKQTTSVKVTAGRHYRLNHGERP